MSLEKVWTKLLFPISEQLPVYSEKDFPEHTKQLVEIR